MRGMIFLYVFLFFGILVTGQDVDYLVVDKISVTGNNITKEAIILRELSFEVGDTLKKLDILPEFEKSINNLNNTLLFNFAFLDFRPSGDRMEVMVEVVERWYVWPVPIFEIAERNFPAWLRDPDFEEINYGMWLNWNNFRGRREILTMKARFGYREQYSLGYSKPNLDRKQRHGLEVSANLFRQREVILKTENNQPVLLRDGNENLYEAYSATMLYKYRPRFYLRQNAGITFSRVTFGNDSLRKDYIGTRAPTGLDWLSASYNLEYDNRDYKVYPLDGYYFRLSLLQRGLGIVEDFNYRKTFISIMGTHHQNIRGRWYYENALKVRLTKDEPQPYALREGLGYTTNIRGYEYYIVDGNSYVVSVNNLKYNLLPQKDFQLKLIPWEQFNKIHLSVYSNLFFDFAYVQGNYFKDDGNDLVNSWLWSTGIGFDLVTYYDQVYRLEFTLNGLGEFGVFLHLETPFNRW